MMEGVDKTEVADIEEKRQQLAENIKRQKDLQRKTTVIKHKTLTEEDKSILWSAVGSDYAREHFTTVLLVEGIPNIPLTYCVSYKGNNKFNIGNWIDGRYQNIREIDFKKILKYSVNKRYNKPVEYRNLVNFSI